MLFLRSFFVVLLLAATIVWAQADEHPFGYSSPEEAWEAYHKALDTKDIRKAFECLTPGAQEDRLEACVDAAEHAARFMDLSNDLPERLNRLNPKLQRLMESHGIGYKELERRYRIASEAAERNNVDLSYEQERELSLGSFKGDRIQFVVLLGEVMEEYEEGMSEYERLHPYPSVRSVQPQAVPNNAEDKSESAKILGLRIRGERAVMLVQQPLPTDTVMVSRGKRVTHTTTTHYFRRIDGRWFIASEENEPVNTPCQVLKEADIPCHRDFSMDAGDSILFEMPGGKTIAFWCRGTPAVGQLLEDSSLNIAWGEKPYRHAPLKYRPTRNGRTVVGSDSYIRTGAVITSSQRPGLQRELFVGIYHILMDEKPGKGGEVSLSLSFRKATELELLVGVERTEYLLKQLASTSADVRLASIKELTDIAYGSSDNIGDAKHVVEAIGPLLKDSDKGIAEQADRVIWKFQERAERDKGE